MRKTIIITLLCVSSLMMAQDILRDMPRVIVHQDSTITRLINDKIEGRERQAVEIQGYRVQIFSSNRQQTAKAEAFALEKRLQEMNLSENIYVLYNPPFWKVRIGDFRTQEDAQLLKEDLITRLPDLQGDTYVVRDKITVME